MRGRTKIQMKKKIAIIAGGDSSEYEVSLRSAAGIYSFLDHERYDTTIVRMRGNDWQALPNINPLQDDLLQSGAPIDKNDFSYIHNGQKHHFDFAYITIHGTPGENGVLQGYLDMLRIPYSCCGVLAAALSFNKYACNHYLSGFGIRTAKSILLRAGAPIPSAQSIVDEVGLPCFIKSNVGGSSFGCSKVKHIDEVVSAIEKAFAEGGEVICEAFLQGTEVTCGVYKTQTKSIAFPITEVVTENEFFDYDAKYKG
jgi:D-alanine-D-alanine ligase